MRGFDRSAHDLARLSARVMDLTGTKKGCDQGQCGACTIHINGRRMNSCLALAAAQPAMRS